MAQDLRHTGGNFVLEFFPDKPLAAAARKGDETVTVLDLKSGVPQLIINTSIGIYGLRPIESTIVVIGDEKVIKWNLPGENILPGARMNVEDSTQTIQFRNKDNNTVAAASISLDSRYIALASTGKEIGSLLDVYCLSTGQDLRVKVWAPALWFAPGRHSIWCAANDKAEVFTITQDTLIRTKSAVDIEEGSWGCPWGSSQGYEVTDDGWVLGVNGKRLLMLPPLWQPPLKVDRVWDGRFLALLHGALPQPVILELDP